MKIKHFREVVLFIASVALIISYPAQARRIKTTDIEYDSYGAATYYEFDQGFRRITSVRDSGGNLIEEYLYDGSLPAEDALVNVRIRNIETGEWIELRRSDVPTMYSYTFNIYIDGNNAGDISWDYRYSENLVSVESLDISGATGRKAGFSIINWLAKYSLKQEGIGRIRCSTHNPIMVDTIAKVLLPEESIYAISEISEDVHSLSEPKVQILYNVGGFYIDIEGVADTFGEGRNKIVLDGNIVISSQWSQLPVGTNMNEVGISDRWIVTLDGNVIGQVKYFAASIEI
ncbi:MAG: hypothetical protein P9X27_05480, partial [Candidatus Kaelpia aquatica]|nr:hypothetical protein [Candidatus Kaelpia aquatica]